MDTPLNLEINKSFVDAKGIVVVLIGVFTEDDTEYKMGYRFLGDNDIKYCADGSVTGRLGDIKVDQHGAVPLVAPHVLVYEPEYRIDIDPEPAPEPEPFRLKLGSIYINSAGFIAKIVGVVPETSSYHARGYRYVDDRGTYYREDGVTADQGVWVKLNLLRLVELDEITQHDLDEIEKRLANGQAWADRREWLDRARINVVSTLKRWGLPIGVGIGAAASAAMAR